MKNYAKSFLFLVSLAFSSYIAFKYYSRKKKEHCREINEVIMFAYGGNTVKKSKFSRCLITESMDRLLYYINLPKHNIDICMYVITNSDLTNVLLKLHYRGVHIRIIIDADMAYTSGSNVRRLERLGIPVRWMKSTNLMHHKFCLMDTASNNGRVVPFVMLGSLNWTNQALSGNWEDVLVTSQKDIVEGYKREFEKLWILFTPIVL